MDEEKNEIVRGEMIENDLIVITRQTMDFLLKQENAGEIIALYMFYYNVARWQKTNQVWATDVYAGKCLKFGRERISRAKSFLIESGLIERVSCRKNGKIDKWYVRVNYMFRKNTIDDLSLLAENEQVENCKVSEKTTNALSNNTRNALSNNIVEDTQVSNLPIQEENLEDSDNSKPEWALPSCMGKTPALRLIRVYGECWNDIYGTAYRPLSFGKNIKLMSTLLKQYTEYQGALLIMTHFHWHGASGTDSKEYNYLSEKFFPIEWINHGALKYETFLRNHDEIEFDNSEKVKEIVNEFLDSRGINVA